MKIIFVSFLSLLISFYSFSQKGKDYFLIDSVHYETLSKNDKALLDSILPLYHEAKSDTERLKYLNILPENISDENTWPKYNKLVFNISQRLLHDSLQRDEKEIKFIKKFYAGSLQNFGVHAHEVEANDTKALEYYETCLKIQEEIGDMHGKGFTLNNMANIFQNEGDISKALDYYFKCLKTHQEINDTEGVAYAALGIGRMYIDQKDTTRAREYLNKAMKLFEKLGNKRGIVSVLGDLAAMSRIQGNLQKTLDYYIKYLNLCEDLGEKIFIASALRSVGTLYLKQFQEKKSGDNPGNRANDSLYAKGLSYLNRGLKVCEEINDKREASSIMFSIGNGYLLQNDLANALNYGKRSLGLAKEIGYPTDIYNAANLLYKIYRKQNKWQDALVMYGLFVQMHDSTFNLETQKSAFKQHLKYEYEKQQALKEVEHQKELTLAEEGKKRQQVVTYSIGFGLLMVILFSIFIFNRLQITRKQKLIIESQKQIVDQKNIDITDSINYAKRIQDAILPSHEELSNHFPNHFVFFRPKDIVSGDFYWYFPIPNHYFFEQDKNNQAPAITDYLGGVLIAVVDCTGHGVPGAFMSMIGNTLLNKIVNEQKIFQPAEILNQLQKGIVSALHQDSRSQDDGMDISVCLFNKEKNKIIFSGANHSMLLTHEKSIQEIKGDIYSIGSVFRKKNVLFTQKEILLQKKSNLYFFTDGFADQVGGANRKKFLTKQLEKLLTQVFPFDMNGQKEIIIKAFEDWKGIHRQLDDVLMVGINT